MPPVLVPDIQSHIQTGGGIIFPPTGGEASEGNVSEK